MVTKRERIPWDEIDPEIRPLVEAMNAIDGIHPVGSCAGHQPVYSSDVVDYYEGYVIFRADSIEAWRGMIDAFYQRVQGRPYNFLWALEIIFASFKSKTDDGPPVWILTFGGTPLTKQRELLRKSATTLSLYASRQQATKAGSWPRLWLGRTRGFHGTVRKSAAPVDGYGDGHERPSRLATLIRRQRPRTCGSCTGTPPDSRLYSLRPPASAVGENRVEDARIVSVVDAESKHEPPSTPNTHRGRFADAAGKG